MEIGVKLHISKQEWIIWIHKTLAWEFELKLRNSAERVENIASIHELNAKVKSVRLFQRQRLALQAAVWTVEYNVITVYG